MLGVLACVANGVSTLPDVAVDAPFALGMAVMLGWRCVHGTVCHEESRGMMQAALAPQLAAHISRSSEGEHEIYSSACDAGQVISGEEKDA